MNLQQRIEILQRLGNYMESDSTEWKEAKAHAHAANNWFLPEFIELATSNIAKAFLQAEKLAEWTKAYPIEQENQSPRTIGLVTAGNIPLVGFHDFLSIFISGHRQTIKLSAKDNILLPHLIKKLMEWAPELEDTIQTADLLKGCDAYIATGSNNSGRYFDYYFKKYPHIIRRNRTSVAILNGKEKAAELEALADDMQLYFGLGCRNVTQLLVPEDYDFEPLIQALKKYAGYLDFHKYRHNFDYQLAILILNKKFYMNGGALILEESASPFAPLSVVHYQKYKDREALAAQLKKSADIQCIVGEGFIPFGQAQIPSLTDYADGVDTLRFLSAL